MRLADRAQQPSDMTSHSERLERRTEEKAAHVCTAVVHIALSDFLREPSTGVSFHSAAYCSGASPSPTRCHNCPVAPSLQSPPTSWRTQRLVVVGP